MKHIISFTIILNLLIAPASYGYEYIERKPEAIQNLVWQGVGAEYYFKDSNQIIRRVRIQSLTRRTDGSVSVKYTEADKKMIVSFVDEENFTYEAAPETNTVGESSSSGVQTPTDSSAPSSGAGLGVGLGAGIQSALVAGIIASTGYAKQIEAAYARIAELEEQMADDFARIEQAKFSTRDELVRVSLRATQTHPKSELIEFKLTRMSQGQVRSIVDQSDIEISRMRFMSTDIAFLNKANQIKSDLMKARITDSIEESFFHISKNALAAADKQNFLGRQEDAKALLNIARMSADVLVGLDPLTGTVRSLYEAVTGKNMVTGEELSAVERTFAVVGIVTAGYMLKAAGGFKLLQKLSSKVAPASAKGLELAEKILTRAGLVKSSSAAHERVIRSINLLSERDAKWGLTAKHLDKHFTGNHKFSLKSLDPAGDTSKWMNHMSDLFQRPITRTLSNGAVDIVGTFEKADKTGTFQMGVRLFDNKNGTFDLVTVLTKQFEK